MTEEVKEVKEEEKDYTVAEDDDYLFVVIKATKYKIQTLTHTEKYITVSFSKKKD